MSGSPPEPGEAPVATFPFEPPRPPLDGESVAERWAMWRREPRLITAASRSSRWWPARGGCASR